MPHADNEYGFEWKVLKWAVAFSESLSGEAHVPFLILFTAEGHPLQAHFGPRPEQHDHEAWSRLKADAEGWLQYDPFEGPVYTYISWARLPMAVMERLLGAPFDEQDFTSGGKRIDFPVEWGVMF